MFKTVAKILVAASAALLLLSGCASPGPKVAAEVGGDQITVSRVDSLSRAASAAYAQAGSETVPSWGDLRAAVLNVLINGRLIEMAMQVANAPVSEAQLSQLYNTNEFVKMLAADPDTAELAKSLAYITLAQNSTAIQAILPQVLANTPVTVNPQFGVWDPSAGSLSGESASLSNELPS